MKKKRLRFAAFIFLIAAFSFSAHAMDWTLVDSFQPESGVYALKIYRTGKGEGFSVVKRANVLVVIRGDEKKNVSMNGLSASSTIVFNDTDKYSAYVKAHPGVSFDDSTETVEEKLDAGIYDRNCSYSEFISVMNDSSHIFHSENREYRLYGKSYDREISGTIETTYLMEPLILNLEDYIDESAVPTAEELEWKKSTGFKPAAGTYDVKMTAAGVDSETGISADSIMYGHLVIKGVNSYSRVTLEFLDGTMIMKFDPIRYEEAKSLYKMAYGNSYTYSDENHTISGNLDYDSLSSFNNMMTYKEFLEMGWKEVYSGEGEKYKIVRDSDSEGMKYLMTIIMERK